MNSKVLYQKSESGDFNEVKAFYCSSCGTVHRTKEEGDKCCVPRLCKCGKETGEPFIAECGECGKREREEWDRKKWESMPIVNYEKEPLYYKDKYYPDALTLIDDVADYSLAFVEAQPCMVQPIGEMHSAEGFADDIEEQMLCEFEEGIIELKHKDKLIEILQKWLDKETSEVWTPRDARVRIEMPRNVE